VGERCLRKGLDADVYLDTVVEGVTVDEEMVEAVQVYVDYVNDLKEKGYECEHEVRFDLAPLNPPGPMFGTADTAAWNPTTKHLVVPDYKHGVGVVVDAFENPQGMMYALGAIITKKIKPEKITIVIVQPRAHHADGIVRLYDFGWDELVEFKKALFADARRTLDEDAPIVVGEWCRFCPALAVCPAQKEHAVVVAQDEFEVIEDQASLPVPEAMDDDQLRVILEKMGIVKAWFNAVSSYVQSRLENGDTFDGYKLVPKRATRKWTNEEEADAYLSSQGIDDEERYTRKLLSVAQAEKAIRARAPRGQKKHTHLPEELVNAESSGHNMVPDSDSRPAIDYRAGDEFETA
jgi:hypothetical protein